MRGAAANPSHYRVRAVHISQFANPLQGQTHIPQYVSVSYLLPNPYGFEFWENRVLYLEKMYTAEHAEVIQEYH